MGENIGIVGDMCAADLRKGACAGGGGWYGSLGMCIAGLGCDSVPVMIRAVEGVGSARMRGCGVMERASEGKLFGLCCWLVPNVC